MSGLYSPINRLAESITRPKGTGAEYMNELQKKPGYKPAEAEDRDLQALMALPQMERAAFMEKLKAQANKFPLKMRELGQGQTHHEQYTLPGGENYREILLHTPMPEGKGFPGVPHHFGGTPNILASIMAKDRISPEGKKILHLEEIQSDWHQQGRDGGYLPANFNKQLKEVRNWRNRLQEQSTLGMDKYEYAEHQNAFKEAEAELNKMLDTQEKGVPYGPHAKDWHELALKAMIQHAAENGYDQIAINHGKTVADRYSLINHINNVAVDPYRAERGEYRLQATGKDGKKVIDRSDVKLHELDDYIGEELAAKARKQLVDYGKSNMAGLDLETGGKGMKKFYDQMVPTFLNKFGKKHGVQVQQGGIDVGENPHEVVADYSDPKNIYAVRPEGSTTPVSRHFSMHDAYKAADKLNQSPLHTFDITPAMREDVMKNGIPRYDKGGIIHKAEGGSMNLTTDQMRAALMGKSNTTSLSNLQSVGANEAPSLPVKSFIPPHGRSDNGSIPVGGVDENVMQPGQQMMPQQPQQQQPGQPQAGAQPQQGQPQPPQGPQSNILSMTPQGQAMAAMRPAGMADGGVARFAKGGNAKKTKTPQEKALEIARLNAIKMLGLHENNTNEERAKALGFIHDYMHGTERLDRFLSGKAPDSKRATSGPMPYGTDSPMVASNYSQNKADTSRISTDEGDAQHYFQVHPKQLGFQGRSPISVEQSYHYLKPEQKKIIAENARNLGYENTEEATGNFVAHKEPGMGLTSPEHYDYILNREARGNPLKALRILFHDSGTLFGNEHRLDEVFKAAGYPHSISQSNAPWAKAEGVMIGKMRSAKPLDTSDTKYISETVLPHLEKTFSKDRSKAKNYGSDQWDKEHRFTPKQWTNQLKNDVSKGENSFVWTSIPDKVTHALRNLGHDSILDMGGKQGGQGHQVAIPFSPEQLRSKFAAYDPARLHEKDLLAAKGGAVKIHTDKDTMMLELSRKQKVK